MWNAEGPSVLGRKHQQGKRKRGSDDPTKKSIIDKKKDSTLTILECADRLVDCAALLRECLDKMNNPDEIENVKKTINESVLPFIDNGSKAIRAAAVATSSVAAIKVAHDRYQLKEKRKVMSASKKKPPLELMVEHTTNKLAEINAKNAPPASLAGKPPPPNKASVKRLDLKLDVPMNGTEYTKIEAVLQLRKTESGSKERAQMMKRMRDLGYVPVQDRTLQRLMERDRGGERIGNVPWSNMGKPPLLTDEGIDDFIHMLKDPHSGFTLDRKSIKKFIVAKKREQLDREGSNPALGNQIKVSDTTLRNYMTIIGIRQAE